MIQTGINRHSESRKNKEFHLALPAIIFVEMVT
mgnify:CR=1 FL=1